MFLAVALLLHIHFLWRLYRGPRRALFPSEFPLRREWLIELARREAAPAETVLWAAASDPMLVPCSCTRRIYCSLREWCVCVCA